MQINKSLSSKILGLPTIGQQGMAAILVTTVLITVIGLIIIGFSLTVRRNQRETLDNQLSTQAFYAAETGVNAARSIAKEKLAASQAIPSQLNCDGEHYPKPTFDGAPGVSVTCLEVKNTTQVLRYDSVVKGSDTVVPATASSDPARIELRWLPTSGSKDPSTCSSNSSELPRSQYPNCPYGLLRVDTVANTPDWRNAGFASTYFIKPVKTGVKAVVNFGTNMKTSTKCDDTDGCTATINTSGINNSYFLKVRSLYQDSSLEVRMFDSSNNLLELSGQISIDSTGKAQDVLRRINVRVSVLPGSKDLPIGAIESSGDVCKRFIVWPGEFRGGALPNKFCQ